MEERAKSLVIIPAFNEENNVGNVIREIRETNPLLDILVINDGSHDNTEKVARRHGATVISLPFNLGIGGAVQTGFKFAQKHGYELAIQIDGDGQHIADEIPKIMEPVQSGTVDVCIGSRYLGPYKYQTPPMRRAGMIIFSLVNSLLIGQRITDNTSGFRAFNRRAIAFLAHQYPTDYPEPETVVILGRNGFAIGERAVKMRQRQSGESSINSVKAIYYMIKVLLAIIVDVFKKYQKVGVASL